MKLYWSSRSPFVRKVMIAAHELGLADRIETVPALVGIAQLNPGVMADNPLNRIPTLLLEDGTALYDSLTICEYLDGLAGPRLFPAGPARWTALNRHAQGSGLLETLVLWRAERGKPPPQQSPEWRDAFAAKTRHALDHFERLAPELLPALDIGQIAIGTALSYLDFRFDDLAWRRGRDALAAWHAGFERRPAVQATRPIDA
ncbi:MAG: glutathione S-transferase [Acetobacteraceae bacterium]